MNPVERGIRRIDAAQQRNKVSAFIFGVVKKYGDDNAGSLAASLAHSAFVAVFPLLLILVTILGLVAAGNSSLRHDVLNAAAKQFPLIGNQLAGNVHALRRSSVLGLIAGLLGLIWGATGLAQAGLFTMEQIWNLPGPARPGYWQRLGRALVFLGVLGSGVIVTTLLTGLDTYGHHAAAVVVLAEMLAVLANVGLYFVSFRVLTPKGVPSRALFPGAVAGGAGWTLLQAAGGYLVHHYVRTDSVYSVFGIVLGLVAWLYLVVQMTVYAAEVNAVLARHLWPRSIIQPPLTESDRAAMALQALQNQRRDEQHVRVSFTDRPRGTRAPQSTPRTPEEIAPPARPGGNASPD
ncbi:MAG TPA: YihY/virulence factor BrkB family protein [Streptosporangiaceae bacterium]|nr:YihY/virulence factor BrkB family protein [Streptosporangiaceae bacterium]